MVSQPALSVNKLAEYIDSKGARQRAILKQRKYPDEEFEIGMYYREASDAVSSYVANGCEDSTPLNIQLAKLNQINSPKVGTQRRANSNIDALEKFLDMLDDLKLGAFSPVLGAHSTPKLTYHNVQISVRPNIILRGKSPKGKSIVGAWKFNLSNTCHFNEDMAGHVSALLQEYLKLHIIKDDEIVSAEACQLIDIASKQVFPGVKAITLRLKDIAAECQNIAALWPTI